MTVDSSHLINAARLGSPDAQADLFAAHWREAWRTARAICGDDHRAEDIAQDALIKALGALDSYDRRRPFGAWLRRIVVNHALNALRRDRRLTGLDDAATVAAQGKGAWEPGLAAAVRALPADRRVVVTLRYGLDLTPPEIADAMDLPVGTVHSRLARALGDLRQSLEVTDAR